MSLNIDVGTLTERNKISNTRLMVGWLGA